MWVVSAVSLLILSCVTPTIPNRAAATLDPPDKPINSAREDKQPAAPINSNRAESLDSLATVVPTAFPTSAPTLTTTPAPTATLVPTPVPATTRPPEPTFTPVPTPTPTSIPTPTPTALPTAPPSPTATLAPPPTLIPTVSPTPTATPNPPFNASGCGPGQVDVNSASAQQLDLIIHIGPLRAAEMVQIRPFSSIEDLVRIKGIGPSRLDDIKQQGIACVG